MNVGEDILKSIFVVNFVRGPQKAAGAALRHRLASTNVAQLRKIENRNTTEQAKYSRHAKFQFHLPHFTFTYSLLLLSIFDQA
jgi:hypothetical protein